MPERAGIHGVLGRYATTGDLRRAVEGARAAGWQRLEAYSPLPVPGLDEGPPPGRDPLARATLAGGLAGALGAFALQYYAAVIAFPIDIGGRPLDSWPAFIPVSLEFGIAGAAAGCVLAWLVGAGLPRLHHPVFDAAGFEAASRDGFFLCLRPDGGDQDPRQAHALLERLGATEIQEVAE